jgi:protein-tyrosine phosphatase
LFPYGHAVTVLETQPERFWELEGCCNFRDLGGYRTATGATLRWNKLFRSDSLASASLSDRARLRRLGLAAVVDLRSEHEIALAGQYQADGVAYHHLPLGDLLAHEARWDEWSDPAYVADRYFELCMSAQPSIVEALAILTDPAAYPAVIHCSIGKDRTGVLIALIMRAIGVSVEDIIREYELSRIGAERLVARLRTQMGADQGDLDPYLPALLAADPETMRRFLRHVHDEFGSVRGYLCSLGIGSTVEHLRAALLD